VPVVLAATAACGDDSSGGLSVLEGATPMPTSTSSPSPSVMPSASTASPVMTSPTTSPSATATDGGGNATAGDLSSDEFAAYVDDVAPHYDEITTVEAAMVDVIAKVEEDQISPGQGGRRLERLGWKLDPPVTELAAMYVPAALEDAHTAWLDGISFEAQGFARLSELMASGTYQRGAVDPKYDALMTKASDKWTEWQNVVEPYEAELGIQVPWTWPNE
jgi:hypothetical protein